MLLILYLLCVDEDKVVNKTRQIPYSHGITFQGILGVTDNEQVQT